MNGQKTYKSLLIKNFGLAAGLWLGYAILLTRYVSGLIGIVNNGAHSNMDVLEAAVTRLVSSGVISFNIFIDLFLCTLVMFFMNYMPKKFFTGKKRLIFRSFTILPIAYEVGCIVLKILASRHEIRLSPIVYPLFTVKPTMTFVLFIVLAFYLKTREWRFRRHGKTHEEYRAFLRTNKNSWDFSLFLAITMLIIGSLDMFIYMRVSTIEYSYVGDVSPDHTPIATIMGFGNSSSLITLAPLVLLFSYTRKPKTPILGTLAPIAAISLIVVMYVEAAFQALAGINIPKVDMYKVVTEESKDNRVLERDMVQLLLGLPPGEAELVKITEGKP